MVLRKTKAQKDEVLDVKTDKTIAKTFGSHSMAIIISELINAHVEVEEVPEESNFTTLDTEEEEAKDFAKAHGIDPSEVEDPVEVKESGTLNKN